MREGNRPMEGLIGKTLAQYWIISDIGRGGIGKVYEALDSSRNRYVALKMLPLPVTFDTGSTQCFLQYVLSAHKTDQDAQRTG